jgi:hypothetical protein
MTKDDDKLKNDDLTTCKELSDVGSILNDFGGKGQSGKENEITEPQFKRACRRIPSGCGCISKDGPFGDWKDFEDRKCLARGVDWSYSRRGKAKMPLRTALAAIVANVKTFPKFHQKTYGRIHGMPHVHLGGHMGRMWSPQDPIFFSHHAFIDKLWYNHQDCHDHDDKEKALWEAPQLEAPGRKTSRDQELPFCMPRKFTGMKWAQVNKELLSFLKPKASKSTHWCGESPAAKRLNANIQGDSHQMSNKGLSTWENNYRLGDWVDSHNLPGEGNNVMYWPDEYDRIVADKFNEQKLCSMTKVQRATTHDAKTALALMETSENTFEKAVLEHHASMYAPFSRGGYKKMFHWNKLKTAFNKNKPGNNGTFKLRNYLRKDDDDRHEKALKNWDILKKLVMRHLKAGVERDLDAMKKGGIDAAVQNECEDSDQWDSIHEESEPMHMLKHWFIGQKDVVEQKCFDNPLDCNLISECKKLRMKLKKDDEECGAHNDNRDACIEIEKCVWLRDTKEEGKGKCV